MICKIKPYIAQLNDKDKNTLLFAANELQKYLSAVSEYDFPVICSAEYNKSEENAVYLGIGLSEKLPEVEDKSLDDAILIDVKEFSGIITGANARAVLIAVYRYLKQLGFSFIRPGKDGEYYPDSLCFRDVYVCEKPSYRHRGMCIEGTVFQKNMTDVIDWLPKAAMNGYYIQFQLPRVFFDRWYIADSPYRKNEILSDDDIMAIMAAGEQEMEKRSIVYHGVGHGWTTQAFGIDGSSWSTHDEPEEQYRDVLALINGERKLCNGIPMTTNLCYSSEKARNRVTDNVLQYCKDHPNIEYLHFWLADGTNNNCECENCRTKRTSDFYVQMLNELDQKLKKEKLDTKIVFLIYSDLRWKPLYEKLEDSSRFIMMFAPSRSYSVSFSPDLPGKMDPYVLNNLKAPKNTGNTLAYLRDWQQDFHCDSFDFDYHFMWDLYYDFAQYNHAQILYNDILNLEAIGLNGLMSCQVQRAFMPTSLNMNIMTEALWDKSLDFDVIADKVLRTEFGEDFKKVKEYLHVLSDLSCAKALRLEEDIATSENVKKLTLAIKTVDDFAPYIEKGLENAEKSSAWKRLQFHGQLFRPMLELFLDAAKGNIIADYSHITDLALKNELAFKDEFDTLWFVGTLRIIVNRLNKDRENKKELTQENVF